MQITVDLPAAWFLLPLDSDVVRNSDLDDDPPRYDKPPRGGWQVVGDAVVHIYERLQQLIGDPLTQSLSLDVDIKLARDQEWIVGTWFCTSEAPQLGADDDSWINGRHRTWGLRSAGFHFAPVLLVPFDEAIHLWEPDPLGWAPLNSDNVANQRDELARWRRSPWAAVNPKLEERWSAVLDRWDARLADDRPLH